jgi:hypothetical protein
LAREVEGEVGGDVVVVVVVVGGALGDAEAGVVLVSFEESVQTTRPRPSVTNGGGFTRLALGEEDSGIEASAAAGRSAGLAGPSEVGCSSREDGGA